MKQPYLTNRVMRGLLLLTDSTPSILSMAVLGGILDERTIVGIDKDQIEDVSKAITWIYRMEKLRKERMGKGQLSL